MANQSLLACVAEIKANSHKHYAYVLSRPCGEPFYVGVGTARRILHHERSASSAKQSAKYEVMREIAASGQEVLYKIIFWSDIWEDAAKEERRLIAYYGRADSGLGPLANRTNGGQGLHGFNYVMTQKRIDGNKAAADKNRGRKLSNEHREKLSIAGKGRVCRQETLDRRSAALKGKPLTPETIEKLRQAKLGKKLSDYAYERLSEWNASNKKQVSEKFKANWSNPILRAKMMKSREGQTRSQEQRAKQSATMKLILSDVGFSAKRNAARQAVMDTAEYKQKQKDNANRLWSSPEFREKMAQSRRNKAALLANIEREK